MSDTEFRIFGVRHHGVGSARSLLAALERWQPDAVLIEGAPEADKILSLAALPDTKPPVALLVYQKDEPGRCAFFPFASFSPEWQALRWALQHGAAARMIDLPQTHWQALREEERAGERRLRQDPMAWIAATQGYTDSEVWWEQFIEYRHTSEGVFAAVLELMQALRQEFPETDTFTLRREAAMRKQLRKAQKDGFERVAVVCGAWHAPALVPEDFPTQKADNELLKKLPKVKVAVSWAPWSNERLSRYGGYGAGVQSPAWYEILWQHGADAPQYWMARAAQLLREEQLDASTAQVIDAVRLAKTLAQLRERALPGLDELLEAAQTVLTDGEEAPRKLIERQLVIGDAFGEVPAEAPLTPLQQDFKRLTRKLRLKPGAKKNSVEFDLRKPLHLEKSRFLHRLNLLNIAWGRVRRIGTDTSSFSEVWALDWKNEYEVRLIEANNWGNTVGQAATAFSLHEGERKKSVAELSEYLSEVILADLPEATEYLARRIESASVDQEEVWMLMEVVFPLANTLSYSNLRQTDTALLREVMGIVLKRIFLGLPDACADLSDELAQENYVTFKRFYQTLVSLPSGVFTGDWAEVLERIASHPKAHGLFAGRTQRMLLDARRAEPAVARQYLSQALSAGTEVLHAGAWLEGFLDGGASLLRFQTDLWALLDQWLAGLDEGRFMEVLPVLRRTFSQFSDTERQRLFALAEGETKQRPTESRFRYDPDRTRGVEKFVEEVFGVE